jgi:hypothetical protein
MGEDTRAMSYGEKAVGITFNPSNDPMVQSIKERFANLIDEMDALRNRTEDGEVKRMCSVAITELQTAQMWAVKAATYKA